MRFPFTLSRFRRIENLGRSASYIDRRSLSASPREFAISLAILYFFERVRCCSSAPRAVVLADAILRHLAAETGFFVGFSESDRKIVRRRLTVQLPGETGGKNILDPSVRARASRRVGRRYIAATPTLRKRIDI